MKKSEISIYLEKSKLNFRVESRTNNDFEN